ncbi:hypothetical protein ABIC55_000584 [Sporosarcina psychrophila]|uniref:Uncharacterized protein n=1 Tax=Sporosarcina psychrophila TaxID=1476 RepID=A0ABV2K334_SPOPS
MKSVDIHSVVDKVNYLNKGEFIFENFIHI